MKSDKRIFLDFLLRVSPALIMAIPVLFILILKISPNVYTPKWDECLYVYDSQRLLSGQVPYRDFFNFTPPGTFLLQSLWYWIWGGRATLTLGRYLSALTAFVTWILLTRTLLRAGWNNFKATLVASLYPIVLYSFWPIPSHHWFSDIPFILAFEAWDFKSGRVKGSAGWAWIGAMMVTSAIFLQTTGLIAGLFWGTVWILGKKDRTREFIYCLTGGLAILAPFLLWLSLNGATGSFFSDTFVWTFNHYAAPGGPNAVSLLGDLPLRIVSLWRFPPGYSPFVAGLYSTAGTLTYLGILLIVTFLIILALIDLVGILRAGTIKNPFTSAAMLITIVGLTLYLRGKTDWLHLVYIIGMLSLAWCAAKPAIRPGRKTPTWIAVGTIVLLSLSIFWQSGFLMYNDVMVREFLDVDKPVRDAPVNRFLRDSDWLKPRDSIVALPEGGEVYLYVRPAAIGYTLLTPLSYGYNSLEDHRVAADEMEQNRPRCVVLTTDTEKQFLNPDSPVARLIMRDFTRRTVIGDAVIYLRKSEK